MTRSPVDEPSATTVTPVIELHDAAFGYEDTPVVSGLNLTIEPGEIVAVLGPNGAGKSTVMKGILGLNEHLGGEVEIFGTPAEDFHERYRLGYVPQRNSLSASVPATATEIVATGRLPRLGWFGRLGAKDRAVVARSLELVGLADRAGTEVATLSGGQQRRVLIARALAGEPDVLIMDEPTAGVDLANQHVLTDVLRRLIDRGVTMIIVTHELGALEGLLTRIVVVDGGHIAFDGTPQEYAAVRHDVHHDHDSHHHDTEDTEHVPATLVRPAGPFDLPEAPRG